MYISKQTDMKYNLLSPFNVAHIFMYLMLGLDNLLHFSLEKTDSFFLSSYCLPVVFAYL